ncbi:MAG: hypothetical protein KJ983_00400 [Candidatus Omnitrophica bacterium]|nr:hypothetical protein [Candidatus Omnitrophota bacterium]
MEKYIHCGQCWGILGEIPDSDSERIFSTGDCGFQCKCGRYNVSSDGCVIKYDCQGNQHWIYFKGKKESHFVMEQIPEIFDFEKLKLLFTNPIWEK